MLKEKEKILNLVLNKEGVIGDVEIEKNIKETQEILEKEKDEDVDLDLNTAIREIKAIITQTELDEGVIEFRDLLESIRNIIYIAKSIAISEEDYKNTIFSYVSKINSIISSILYRKSELETIQELDDGIKEILDYIEVFKKDYEEFRRIKENAVLYAIFKQVGDDEVIDSNYVKDVINSLSITTTANTEGKEEKYEEKLNALYSKIADLDTRIQGLYYIQNDVSTLKTELEVLRSDLQDLRYLINNINSNINYDEVFNIVEGFVNEKINEKIANISNVENSDNNVITELIEGTKKHLEERINKINNTIDTIQDEFIRKEQIKKEISDALYPLTLKIEEIEKRLNNQGTKEEKEEKEEKVEEEEGNDFMIVDTKETEIKEENKEKKDANLGKSDLVKLISIIGGGIIFLIVVFLFFFKFVF